MQQVEGSVESAFLKPEKEKGWRGEEVSSGSTAPRSQPSHRCSGIVFPLVIAYGSQERKGAGLMKGSRLGGTGIHPGKEGRVCYLIPVVNVTV